MTAPSTGGWPARASSCSASTSSGLDKVDRAILDAVCARFGGGPVGLSTLAVSVGEETDTVEDVYEPFLLQMGLLMRTPRGRVAMPAAWQHLGLDAPAPAGPAAGDADPESLLSRHRLDRRRRWTSRPMTCPRRPSPRARSNPATRPGCWTRPPRRRTVVHRQVCDLPGLLGPGDVLVVNTSRVLPARLRLFKATGGAAEVLLLEAAGRRRRQWTALVRPGRRLPPGTLLAPSPAAAAVLEVGGRLAGGRRLVRFLADPADVVEVRRDDRPAALHP